jgi:endonuclease/exonuclease/phosphatase family metal-dependent hydrolase
MPAQPVDEIHDLIRRRIAPAYAELSRCNSTAELEAHPLYPSLKPDIDVVLNTVDAGDFRRGGGPVRNRYRIVAWNIERGNEFEGQLEVFRHHDYIRDADVLLLIETDVGMARSGNRDVVREFARELGYAYAFAPCYLSMVKGSGVEYHVEGENDLGLHGNAILSRYPIRNARAIRLQNGRDKMFGREKRIGSQAALAAEIELPNLTLPVVSVHLDAQSSQKHRVSQMRQILDNLPPDGPVILGGDWNTSTYNSSRAFYAICGFWLRVFMGVDRVIRNHYLHPERMFERELFEMLERRGFDFRTCNRLGERTTWYDMDFDGHNQNLREWVPDWCFPFIHWALRDHDNKCPLKLDWFAARGLACEGPRVIHDVREGREVPLSDHDAIGVDIRVE